MHPAEGRDFQFARRPPFVLSLYAGFLFAGAATVLPGAMLPRIAALHHLNDSQAGALLTIQFAASSCGALLVRRRFERTVVRGYALMAAGATGLMLSPAGWAAVAIGVFALGLGIAMTSTSLLVGRLVPEARGTALSLLNFCWSAGAMLCPLLTARLPGRFSLVALCTPLALVSAAFTVMIQRGARFGVPAALPPSQYRRVSSLPAIAVFAAIGFLYVGVETAVGGWMSTYAARVASWNFERSNLAAACFWAALLAGRGLTPIVLRLISELWLQLLSIAAASAGIIALVQTHTPLGLLSAASWTGLALAPIFPLTIALFLGRAGESENAGWVFAIAGFGAAALPWITGVVSTWAHSLRTGLLVCLAADAGMLLLSLLMVFVPRLISLKAAAADA